MEHKEHPCRLGPKTGTDVREIVSRGDEARPRRTVLHTRFFPRRHRHRGEEPVFSLAASKLPEYRGEEFALPWDAVQFLQTVAFSPPRTRTILMQKNEGLPFFGNRRRYAFRNPETEEKLG